MSTQNIFPPCATATPKRRSREFSVRDLEGNLWSFGTYNPHDR